VFFFELNLVFFLLFVFVFTFFFELVVVLMQGLVVALELVLLLVPSICKEMLSVSLLNDDHCCVELD
jgi:hypothetical protein